MTTEFVLQSHRQPDINLARISPPFLMVRTYKDAGTGSLCLCQQWVLTSSLSSFRLEHNATWSAQRSHRKALRLSSMKQSWPFSIPRRRRSVVQSATAAAPFCEATWKEKWDEFSETKQVRKAMKVTCNWNGEHDQKRVLFTKRGALHSVKPPSCITLGHLMSMCFPKPPEPYAACSHCCGLRWANRNQDACSCSTLLHLRDKGKVFGKQTNKELKVVKETGEIPFVALSKYWSKLGIYST